MTTQSEKLGWLLWASVNGYDFNKNPMNYTWAQPVKNKFATPTGSIYANNLLSNMSNSGYSTDDVLIGFANYNMLDSVQLTTSGIEGNAVTCEILTFTGTISKKKSNTTGWICDSVDPNANKQCKTSDFQENQGNQMWLGGDTSTFLNIDPTSANGERVTCVPALNKDTESPGYYLHCGTDGGGFNYTDPYNFPMSKTNSIISSCTN